MTQPLREFVILLSLAGTGALVALSLGFAYFTAKLLRLGRLFVFSGEFSAIMTGITLYILIQNTLAQGVFRLIYPLIIAAVAVFLTICIQRKLIPLAEKHQDKANAVIERLKRCFIVRLFLK